MIGGASGAAVLIAGGQARHQMSCEVYRAGAQNEVLELPGGQLSKGAAATALQDGRVVLIGGADFDGQPLRDAWVLDLAGSVTVKHYPQALSQGRFDHTVDRVGQNVVVIGGRNATGPVTTIEILHVDDLSRVREAPIQVPREGHRTSPLGPGSLLISGGRRADGKPTDYLEVYQTF
jgi:hypothetical protein